MINEYLSKVICGDALEVLRKLPDNSIDLGITSPPYNKKEKHKGWLVDKVVYKGASDNLPEEEYQRMQIEVLNELYRVIKPGGSFFLQSQGKMGEGFYDPSYGLAKKNQVGYTAGDNMG